VCVCVCVCVCVSHCVCDILKQRERSNHTMSDIFKQRETETGTEETSQSLFPSLSLYQTNVTADKENR
jgi:hypothetical protein